MEVNVLKRIAAYSATLDGVFTVRDLEVALNERSRVGLFRSLEKLIASGELFRIRRGIYATAEASLAAIAGTVLAKNLNISSIPARRIQVCKIGRSRFFKSPLGTIEFIGIAPKLFFGFESKGGVNWASAEKAFLDVCYLF